MKVMISMPMAGKHDEAVFMNSSVKEEYNNIVEQFKKLHIEVVDTYFTDDISNISRPDIYFLAKSILAMQDVDAVYFADGWRNARGCEIEHQVCVKYGIKTLYSDFLNYGENNQGIIGKINNNNTITVSDGLIGSNTGIVYR